MRLPLATLQARLGTQRHPAKKLPQTALLRPLMTASTRFPAGPEVAVVASAVVAKAKVAVAVVDAVDVAVAVLAAVVVTVRVVVAVDVAVVLAVTAMLPPGLREPAERARSARRKTLNRENDYGFEN